MISRRSLLAGFASSAAFPALAEQIDRSPFPPSRPEQSVSNKRTAGGVSEGPRLIEAAKLGGAVGYVVADAATGNILEAQSPDTRLPPASVLKTMTTLFALERLGGAHRFSTRVVATGPVQGGVLQGDLILVGGGDPGLQTDALGDLAARLAQTGLRGVTGRLVVDAGALPSLDRIAEDQPEQVGYNPAIAGLNLNFNRAYFEWRRGGDGWVTAVDARGERFLPAVKVVRVAVARREAPLFTYAHAGGIESWTVASGALGAKGSRWLPVRDPARYAVEVFRTLAAAQGIRLPEPTMASAGAGGTLLGRVDSEPLPDMLREMLRFSTNLTAEVVGLSASGAKGLVASGAEMARWAEARIGIEPRFVDHSGLGGESRVSALEMARTLVWARKAGNGLVPLLRSYPMRDDKGNEIAGHPARIMAKSGTLNFVSALAGHIQQPGKRELIFAIFTADAPRRDRIPKGQREDPPGVKDWTRRARRLQGQLIRRWSETYS